MDGFAQYGMSIVQGFQKLPGVTQLLQQSGTQTWYIVAGIISIFFYISAVVLVVVGCWKAVLAWQANKDREEKTRKPLSWLLGSFAGGIVWCCIPVICIVVGNIYGAVVSTS